MCKGYVALACAFGIVVMLPALADEKMNLDADTGLWELTTHPQMTGTLSIPEQQLQKMTPEQRARIEAALQAATQNANQEHIVRQCLTAAERDRVFDLGNESSSCKTTVIRNTSSELEVRRECATTDDVHTTTERLQMSGPRHVSGSVDAVMSRNGKPMTMHMTIEGRWLGADCGAIKGAQVLK